MKKSMLLVFILHAICLTAQQSAPTVGAKLRSLSGRDMVTASIIDIEFANSPAYTLFHFWQSKSDSCIKQFPALQKFVQHYNTKLVTYGFPYEYKQDIPAAKECIAKYKLSWAQLLQYKQTNAAGANVIDVLQITAFPTYFLLDRDGYILVRSNSLDDVEALLQSLK